MDDEPRWQQHAHLLREPHRNRRAGVLRGDRVSVFGAADFVSPAVCAPDNRSVTGHLTPLLRQAGFRTMTPQLRATGSDATPPSQVSLADWVDDLESCLAKEGGEDVTLVAHSFAGYVVGGLLARGTGLARTVVFLDAVLPQAGRSWFDVMGPQAAQYMRSLASDGAVPWYTPEQLNQLHPSHGLTGPDLAWMLAQVTPQPVSTYDQPAMTEPLQPTSARLVYVRCTRTTPPPATVNASTRGWTYRELDSGHWPMVTDPVATARAIDAATRP